MKMRGKVIMGIIVSLLSSIGLTACRKNNFNPAKDAVIVEMHINYSGTTRDSFYHFSLREEAETVYFTASFIDTNDEGMLITHEYEDKIVDQSYMDELRKLATENNLVAEMKKYHEPVQVIKPLDGDSKYTYLVMSDGSQKNASIFFPGDYYSFFKSIALTHPEFDQDPSSTETSDN